MKKQDHSSRTIPPEDPSLSELEIGGTRYRTRLTEKYRKRKNWQRHEPEKVMTFLPGTVQKIMVSEGMEVNQGTPILILEAMKMRNVLLSPVNGTVKKIHVSEGDKVPKGHLLMEFTQV